MGGAVLRVEGVTLRGPKQAEEKAAKKSEIFGFRCPPHIKQYLEQAAKAEGRSMAEIIVFAIELDRDIADMLGESRPKLAAFATANGLDTSRSHDMAKLFVALINRGLTTVEADSKKRK